MLLPPAALMKKFLGFTYSSSNVIPFLHSDPSWMIGQKMADCHFGTIKIPLALHCLMCFIVLGISFGGGTNQQISFCQLYAKASTPCEPWHQILE
jgi:hypothetical protein